MTALVLNSFPSDDADDARRLMRMGGWELDR